MQIDRHGDRTRIEIGGNGVKWTRTCSFVPSESVPTLSFACTEGNRSRCCCYCCLCRIGRKELRDICEETQRQKEMADSPPSSTEEKKGGLTTATRVDTLESPVAEEGPINASGHVQELHRNFGLLSIVGLAITSGNVWIALGGTIVGLTIVLRFYSGISCCSRWLIEVSAD